MQAGDWQKCSKQVTSSALTSHTRREAFEFKLPPTKSPRSADVLSWFQKKKNSGDENASGAIPAFSMNSGICKNRTEVQSGVRGH